MVKATAVKVRVDEVTVGMTIRGNLVAGAYTVAEIRVASSHGGGAAVRHSAAEVSFFDADGREVFVGLGRAKATLA